MDPILSQPNPVRHIYPYLTKIHLNIILPPTSRSFQWSPPFGPPNQNSANTSPLPHACHMSCPPHPPWFNHPNNIRWRIHVVKFIIMQFSPRSVCYNRGIWLKCALSGTSHCVQSEACSFRNRHPRVRGMWPMWIRVPPDGSNEWLPRQYHHRFDISQLVAPCVGPLVLPGGVHSSVR
jgi:hypothetical protein